MPISAPSLGKRTCPKVPKKDLFDGCALRWHKAFYWIQSALYPTIHHMPMTSTIRRLPQALRAELDRRIACDSYGTIESLRAWLASEGETYSHSAIGRYVLKKKRERRPFVLADSAPELLDQLASVVGELRARLTA